MKFVERTEGQRTSGGYVFFVQVLALVLALLHSVRVAGLHKRIIAGERLLLVVDLVESTEYLSSYSVHELDNTALWSKLVDIEWSTKGGLVPIF